MSPEREQEFDGPWKHALEIAFDLFLRLFLLDLHEIVDWVKDHGSQDQELQKLTPASATGVRRVDKLFKAFHKDTDDPRYFHVEAQSQVQPEDEFSGRMYTYSYRGRDLLGQPIISIAILGDDDPKWLPRKHKEGEHGSEVTFTFRTVKLLKWARRQRQLEADENVFALFVSAHLEAFKTRDDPDRRAESKIRLLTNLVNRGLENVDEGKWYNLIDWILPLPADIERQVFQRMQGVNSMTYITYAQRLGRDEGREEGLRTAFLLQLQASLKAKFGDEGEAILAQLPEQTPIARLQELALQVAVATTIDSLRPQFSQS
jgi:hypothetical protein